MVYLRKHLRKGKTYYSVVETFRENQRVKQKILHYIGSESNYCAFLKGAISAEDLLSPDLENLLYQTPVSLWNLTEQFNLTKTFSSHFPKEWGVDAGMASTIMIINYATDHKSKNKLQNWYDQTYLKVLLKIPTEKINSDLLYRTLDFFTEEKIEKIHSEIFSRIKEKMNLSNEILFYDLTAVTFEGNHCSLAKRGYNSEALYKLQVNVGLGVTPERIPVVHKVFEGNTKDVKTMDKITELVKKTADIRSTVFIFDRGMASDENFGRLENEGAKYIAGLPKNKTIQKLILSLQENNFQKADDKTSYFETRQDSRRIILFWNKEIGEIQKEEREKKLQKIEKRLEKLKKNHSRYAKPRLYEKIGEATGKYRRYFVINAEKEFSFYRKEDAIKQAEQLDGKSAIITNTDLSPVEILKRYRDRNFVEMSFRDLKLFVDIRPVRHWKENRVLAHVFLAVLAFGLRSILELKLKRTGINMTAQEAIEKLNRIRVLVANDKLLKLTGESEETRSIVAAIER